MKRNYIWTKILIIAFILLMAVSGAGRILAERAGNIVEMQIAAKSEITKTVYLDNGDMLYGTRDGQVRCLSNGKLKWIFKASNMISELKVDEAGSVYAGSEDRNIYILDRSGRLKARMYVKERIFGIVPCKDSSITIIAGSGKTDYFVEKVNMSGKVLWKHKLEYDSRVLTSTNDGSTIFYGTRNSMVGALDAGGNLLWEASVNNPVYDAIYSDKQQQLLVVNDHGKLFGFNIKGTQVLSTDASDTEIVSVAVSVDGKTIAAGDAYGKVRLFDNAGKLLFDRHYVDYENKDVLISDLNFNSEGKLLVSTIDKTIEVIDAEKIKNIGLYRMARQLAAVGFIVSFLAILLLMFFSNRKLYMKAVGFVKALKKGRTAYLMLLPGFILLIIFMYYPILKAFIMSLTEWTAEAYARPRFIGIENFISMFSGNDPYFWSGFGNMFILTGINILKVITIPVLTAELVFWLRSKRMKYMFRVAFISPMVVPGLVLLLMWKNIYDPNIGLINTLLNTLGLGNLAHAWLGEASTVIGAIAFMGFPWIDGFAFLLYIGALINVPTEIYDCGKIDGCNVAKRFLNIDLPYMRGQLKVMIILYFINGIKDFGGIYLLTQGGPGHASYVPSLELFFHMTRFNNYGYASALGVFLFALTIIGTLINMKLKDTSDMQNR